MTTPVADTLLTNATLASGDVVDVLLRDGLISQISSAASTPAPGDAIDLTGYVLLPAPVEPHAHLDKAFLAELIPNPTGDLFGAIEAMTAHRHLLNFDETVERAERAARLMAANGYVAVRSHADTTLENQLVSVTALVEVKRRVADVIDVEIVALAGSPADTPDQLALLRDAMQTGADLVGGCPYREGENERDIARATDVLLQVATDFGVGVDLHTDETLDPTANGLDALARRVLSGFTLGASASHCVSLGQQPFDVRHSTAERVAEAGIVVIALPQTNLYLQGRGLSPMPRALTALEALRAAGVTVAAGADNLQDPFNPTGRADPFDTANLMVMAGHTLINEAWDTVSKASADALRRPSGLIEGAPADLLAARASSLRTAIAFAPADRIRWRGGVRS
ncbi:MAG TPA: amidohydrolase family protein [Ilumatobacter sp.]|nr:amidohydrolase family protein [Ilumatobacter sp.]